MEIEILRAFLLVADGATVTDVAERSQRTQPSLSRALIRLERRLGTALFQRVGRGLVLTPAGRELVQHARDAVEAYDRGVRSVQDVTSPDAGLVPVAFLHTLGTWLVPDLIRRFRAERPDVRFDLRQHGDAGLVTDLFGGIVDLAITGARPQVAGITSQRLFLEPLRLVVPPDHRLTRRRTARLADVSDEEFILLRPGFSLRDVTEDLCAEAGFVPRIGFEGDEVETLRGLVSAGLGVALVPEHRSGAGPAAPHLRVTDVRAEREIGLAWVSARTLPPASASFRQHVLRTSKAINAFHA